MAYSEILPDPLIFKIYDSFGRELKQLYQWDIDAEIRIKEWDWELGTDEELRCFFSHKNSTESEVMEPTFVTEKDDTITLVSKIPNDLLRRDNDINFFVGVVKETEKVKEDSEETEIVTILRQTIFSRSISVTSRGKPKDYTYSDNTDYISVKVLEQEVGDLVEYIHTAIEDGDLRGPEGPQGPQGEPGPEGPQGPQGPRGYGEAFHLRFTKINNRWNCDKTFQEITEAILAERTVVGHKDSMMSTHLSYSLEGRSFTIFFSLPLQTGTLMSDRFTINSDNEITHSQILGIPDTEIKENSNNLVTNKAIKEYVDSVAIPNEVPLENNSTITLANNTIYRGTNINTVNLTYPSGNFECLLKITFADSGAHTIGLPLDTKYIGATPIYSNGDSWEISIVDGVVVGGRVQ